jgi:hypothetical protein
LEVLYVKRNAVPLQHSIALFVNAKGFCCQQLWYGCPIATCLLVPYACCALHSWKREGQLTCAATLLVTVAVYS